MLGGRRVRWKAAGLTVGVGDDVLPSHAHFVLQKSSAEVALIKLDRAGVSCSSGAACSSGSLEPSHVLLAMGFDEARANRGLRFTFGDSTTLEEATEAARRISRVLDPSQWGADE